MLYIVTAQHFDMEEWGGKWSASMAGPPAFKVFGDKCDAFSYALEKAAAVVAGLATACPNISYNIECRYGEGLHFFDGYRHSVVVTSDAASEDPEESSPEPEFSVSIREVTDPKKELATLKEIMRFEYGCSSDDVSLDNIDFDALMEETDGILTLIESVNEDALKAMDMRVIYDDRYSQCKVVIECVNDAWLGQKTYGSFILLQQKADVGTKEDTLAAFSIFARKLVRALAEQHPRLRYR